MRNWYQFFTFVKEAGFNPTTIVDIGVATDTEDLYFHFPNATYLFVEPCIEFEPNLQRLCEIMPGSTYMLAAAGASNGEITINVSPDMGGTSIFKTIEANDGAYDMTSRTVPMFTLDTMWEALEIKDRGGLLKIDVQGGEIEVLKGACGVIDNFEMILIEVSTIATYVGQPIFHDCIAYLAELGFVLFDIIHLGYADTGILAQMDLVCVKKDGRFRHDQRCIVDYTTIPEKITDYKGVRRNDNL